MHNITPESLSDLISQYFADYAPNYNIEPFRSFSLDYILAFVPHATPEKGFAIPSETVKSYMKLPPYLREVCERYFGQHPSIPLSDWETYHNALIRAFFVGLTNGLDDEERQKLKDAVESASPQIALLQQDNEIEKGIEPFTRLLAQPSERPKEKVWFIWIPKDDILLDRLCDTLEKHGIVTSGSSLKALLKGKNVIVNVRYEKLTLLAMVLDYAYNTSKVLGLSKRHGIFKHLEQHISYQSHGNYKAHLKSKVSRINRSKRKESKVNKEFQEIIKQSGLSE